MVVDPHACNLVDGRVAADVLGQQHRSVRCQQCSSMHTARGLEQGLLASEPFKPFSDGVVVHASSTGQA